MPLFKGFKASLNFSSGSKSISEFSEDLSPVSIKGSYKSNREEFFGSSSYADPPKKITPDMVKLPKAFQPDPTDPHVIKASKSTGDLTQNTPQKNVPSSLHKSVHNVSSDPRGATTNNRSSTSGVKDAPELKVSSKNAKNQEKELKKLEKKRLSEQKKRDKLESQEKAKEEKLRQEREKAELQFQAKQEKVRKDKEKSEAKARSTRAKKETKKKAPAGSAQNPLPQANIAGPAAAERPYSTNTLDSSISKTSGPPPYSEASKPSVPSLVRNESDDTGNTSFANPVESDNTWDSMIAQHRQHISRAPKGGAASKVVIRLQEPVDKENASGRKSLYV